MGDMADFYLGLEEWRYYDDEDHERYVQCKFCKEEGLKWKLCDSGYRLVNEDDVIHDCKEFRKQMKRINK